MKTLYEFIEEIELNGDKFFYTTQNGTVVPGSLSADYNKSIHMFKYIKQMNKKTRKVLESVLVEEK